MAEFPALPLFTDAFLADTDHLTDDEVGLYLRLLMVMWRAPECRLPNDDVWLSRKFRKTPQQVIEQLRPLIKEFCLCDGNWIKQKRLVKVWQWCRRKRELNSDSAKSRWNKEKSGYVRNASNPIHNITPLPPIRGLTQAESEAIVRLRASAFNFAEWNQLPDSQPRRKA